MTGQWGTGIDIDDVKPARSPNKILLNADGNEFDTTQAELFKVIQPRSDSRRVGLKRPDVLRTKANIQQGQQIVRWLGTGEIGYGEFVRFPRSYRLPPNLENSRGSAGIAQAIETV